MKPKKSNKYVYLLFFISLAIVFNARIVFGAVGETLPQMTQRIGTPKGIALNYAVSQKNLITYQKIGVRAYVFTVNNLKIYAVFNPKGVCYKEYTMNERTLPSLSLMIGNALAATKPKILMVIPLRMEKYQYGTGSNAVIYTTFGLPGDLSAKAYSPSLAPSSD